MTTDNHRGSELHRLKTMPENYDVNLFNQLYRVCKPVIRNLVKQIDCRRFNVTPDIIQSYFYDKMLYVFSRYQGTCSKDHLQAKILLSLATFKKKLLRAAYTDEAENNLELKHWDDLFDGDKELEDDSEEAKEKEDKLKTIEEYMKKHLSPDGMLLFGVLMDPPPYIKEYRGNGNGSITLMSLIHFFDMPKNRSSLKFMGELRRDVEYWIERAKQDLV